MNGKYISTLTIAGSDSCGGAGIQADIKTMSALGCYASSVVTAVTAQDTCRVGSVMDVPAEIVREQVHMVLNDIRPQAVKTGMMSNADIVGAVAYGRVPLVVDPVMVATSGDALMRRGTLDVLISDLLPLATLVTPNIPEAAALTGMTLQTDDDLWVAARRILSFGCRAVLIKGGHQDSQEKTDRLLTADGCQAVFRSRTVDTRNTHGTGCTLSSAITAYIARGSELCDAVALAKEYLTDALEAGKAVRVGGGHGAVDHFFNPERLIIHYNN